MNNANNIAVLRREIMRKLGVMRMSDEAFADYAGIHVNTLKRALKVKIVA